MRKSMSKLNKAMVIGLSLPLFVVGCKGTEEKENREDVNPLIHLG